MTTADRAAVDPKGFYDARYAGGGYMTGFEDVFERCRAETVRHELGALATESPIEILDYGCGEGRYAPVVLEAFPHARLTGCDVSAVALERAAARYPGRFLEMADERAPLGDGSVDIVVSVEVLEHVADVRLAASEIGRVLRPGGIALLTTPCANRWSLEWISNRLRGGLQATPDGYGRFATDEPGHLRRLRSDDLEALLHNAGLTVDHFAFRAHLFTTLMTYALLRRAPLRLGVWVAMWDWRLWRSRRNGATMVVVARKSASVH